MDIASPPLVYADDLRHVGVYDRKDFVELPAWLAKLSYCDKPNPRVAKANIANEAFHDDTSPRSIAFNTVALVSIKLVYELIVQSECHSQWLIGHVALSITYLAFELQIMPRPQ